MNCFLFFPLVQSRTERLIIFLPTGLAASAGKEATVNTLSNEGGEEDFPAASASGPCRDWQPTIELCRNNNRAFGMECVWETAVKSKTERLRCYKRIAFRLDSRSTRGGRTALR
ncbi:hypothetical protein ACIXKS_01125 [Bacteroides fragilis]|uniref:hypothetical protein n=2 Tax=Bacteroidia TaxID=200643 RepID=UPI00321C0A7E